MSLIEQGIAKNLIRLEDEDKTIVYLNQNKRRSFINPEEKVQAETFLKLILNYKYNPNRIKQYLSVTMGSEVKEADIIVYNDDECTKPHIVVECKKEEVTEQEFNQAVKQGFAYAFALAGTVKYVWTTSGLKDSYHLVDKESHQQNTVADIPMYGVDKLAKFKYAKNGGKTKDGQTLFDLEVVKEEELTRRFKQAHQALWGGGELNPSEAFDELDKLIFCKIWDERKARKSGVAYDFQIFTEETEEKTNSELLNRIKALYEQGREKDPEVFRDNIRLSAAKCRTVVGYLESTNLNKTDLDSKGRAFETFMGNFFRGDFGQYFTPRAIVKFIVDVLPIKHDDLVLDTSCGSGGFLLHALDKVRRQADDFYDVTSVEHYKHWHDFAEKNLFGIEINEQIARTAKMNMIIHDDGHTNVITSDGLIPADEIMTKTKNQGFKYNGFNYIITNPPFGSVVKSSEQSYLSNYDFAKKEADWLSSNTKDTFKENQSTEILFIEQCHNFLKDNGYLAIVLPDGVLTNSSLQNIRDGIEEKFRIVAVVSMPQTAFAATGAGVKSSVLFVRKYPSKETAKIRALKATIQAEIKAKHDFDKEIAKIDRDKKAHLKLMTGFNNVNNLSVKDLAKDESFIEWKTEVNESYNEKTAELKELLNEEYQTARQKRLPDYPIFMAIAEDIGYDATGKATGKNELDEIGVELGRFVEAINKGEA